MLRNVIVSGCVTFHQINTFFVHIYFFHCSQNGFAGRIKWLRGPDPAAGRNLETLGFKRLHALLPDLLIVLRFVSSTVFVIIDLFFK